MEVVVKVVAEGRKPWRYLTQDSWNVFDFTLVAASYIMMVHMRFRAKNPFA